MRPLIAVMFLLAAANATAATPDQAAIRKAVAAEMRDPASTQFRELRVVETTAAGANVCGEFNGKNGYGGYVGFQPFYAEMILAGKTWIAVVWTVGRAGLPAIYEKCRGG